jgi:peptidoglycan/xylan/chitin deacetylase (PgdA/CDA1 family)
MAEHRLRPKHGSAPRLSILMYHQVGRFEAMQAHRANYCDAGRFARQMALLAQAGFHVLDLEAALAGLRGAQPLPSRAVLLTFDDAYAGFVEHALPVLQRHRFPAVVYAISDWLGERMRWADAGPSRARPLLMSAAQLRALRTAGITVGSHGARHLKLAELDPAQQAQELARSRSALEDLLGEPVEHLCYPFGSFDRNTVGLAAAAGYRSAMTCLRGAATPEDHPLLLPRKAISFGDNLIGFAWKVLVKHRPKPALAAWRRWSAGAAHDDGSTAMPDADAGDRSAGP